MKTLYFIRHGESLSNAGWVWRGHYRDIPLTQKWHSQARQVAEYFPEKPDIIYHTSFLRTRETAEPTIERFAGVPIKTIPMQEFIYLDTSHYAETTVFERRIRSREYWKNSDPHHIDGAEAESFIDLIERIYLSLDILTQQDENVAFIFTHGQILQLTRLLLSPVAIDKTPEELMRIYHDIEHASPIKNGEVLRLTIDPDGEWSEMESVFAPETEGETT